MNRGTSASISKSALISLLVLISCSLASAEVKLPAIFAEHMVVQRNMPVRVWGLAAPQEPVSVAFRGETRQAVADELGRWQVSLPPGAAGGPFTLTVKGTNTIEFTDVLVGDVWVASGQSNMGMSLRDIKNAEAEIASARRPQIRIFRIAESASDYPLEDVAVNQSWTSATPESVAEFSAVGYLFARNVQDAQKVPIGVIQSAWGGTPAEAWTSMTALGADAALMPVFAFRAETVNGESTWLLERDRRRRAVEAARAAGQPEPQFPWHPDLRSWGPAALYNAMIAPIVRYPIKGAIWYQGESNADPTRALLYDRLFQTMIRDWRRSWGIGDFPFLFVQLANFKANDEGWARLRDAQRRTLALNNTGMAVALDIGDSVDIHPKNKQEVARRLALAARAIAYGEKIEYSGPLFRAATPEGSALRVWFDNAAGMAPKGDVLKGFEIAGADHKWVPATARIDGDAIVVSGEQVPVPMFVRYGWAADPQANLYNKAGLPASPFTSE